MEKPKKNKRMIGAFFKGLFRGLVKMIPLGFGNVAIEVGDAMSSNKLPDRKLLNDPNLSEGEAKLIDRVRRWTQVVIQLAVIIVVLYAFFNKQIDVAQLINYLIPESTSVN